jgi:hypothetical protein
MAFNRRSFLSGFGYFSAIAASGTLAGIAAGEDPPAKNLVEPVFRVAKTSPAAAAATASPATNGVAAHSLDEGIALARRALDNSEKNYEDYTATLVKRERVDGVVGQQEFMYIKVRNRKVVNGQLKTPLSVYLTFIGPASVKGREVIYVENRNDGYITAHEGGMKGRFLPTVSLNPLGMLAMKGQRYPISDIGLENLMVKLVERGQTARQYPDVKADFRKNARVKDRTCTVLQVTQPNKRPDLEFYLAQIFIDDQLLIPIRYVAYDWPASEGAKPEVIEEYTYMDLKVNVGLTDVDFDPENPDYAF